MKGFALAVLLLASATLSMQGEAQILFTAKLDGSQESPPVVSSGKGTVWAVLSPDMKTLTYRLTYARLNAARTGGHFHAAGTGNGGVVKAFTFDGNLTSGTWTSLPDSIVRHLLRGEIYANIHSSSSPGGEIRGYLQAVKGVGFTVAMDGSQENPPNASTGSGTGWVVLDSTGTQLAYNVTVAGMTAPLSAGHFHTLPSGGVVHPIAFVDSTADGVWSGVPDTILTSIENKNLYVNVHSSTFPAGELRGYVELPSGVVTGIVETVSKTVPSSFALDQNYPNPFNPSTTIRFQVASTSDLSLKVFNLLGQEVASLFQGTKAPGTYEVSFDARALASGIYFYRLSAAGGTSDTRKMVLVK